MSFSLIPDYAFLHIREISAEFLKHLGITFLMLDLDNTIAPYGTKGPSDEVVAWLTGLKANGIEAFIVSNNRKGVKVAAFAEALGVSYIKSAGKPFKGGLIRAMESSGRRSAECALAGDQIFADIIAANAAGVTSIVVPPLQVKNPLLAVRYLFEAPFRALCANKMWRKRGA